MAVMNMQLQTRALKKKMGFDSMRRQHRKLTKFMALEEAPHGNGAGAES